MTTTTVTRIYATYEQAAQIVQELEAANIPHRDITLLSNSSQHAGLAPYATTAEDKREADTDYDATVGAGAMGGVVGLLTGLGLIALPGLGALAAVGWLGATLAGFTFGAAGGAAGSAIIEGLRKNGVDDATATRNADAVTAGGTLVAVRTDSDRLSTIESIMGTNDEFDTDTLSTANSTSRVA